MINVDARPGFYYVSSLYIMFVISEWLVELHICCECKNQHTLLSLCLLEQARALMISAKKVKGSSCSCFTKSRLYLGYAI